MSLFVTPVTIAFEFGYESFVSLLEDIIDFVFLIDIIMNFRFAYIDKKLNLEASKKVSCS